MSTNLGIGVRLLSVMSFDLAYALVLFAVAGGVALAYALRVFIRGRARSERVDRQGGSQLLSKEIMEGAYWFFQWIARFLVALHITPNQMSWASLFFGIIAGTCLAFGHFGFGAVFATISAVLDALDGLVARVTGVASDAGEVLDAAIDRYVEFFYLAGLAVYYREIPTLLAISLAALAGSFMVSYSTAKAEALHVAPPKSNMRRPERALYLILGAALSPITIPWLETTREYPVPIGHPMVVALCLVAVLANVSAVERLWLLAREIRSQERQKLKAQEAAAAIAAMGTRERLSAHGAVDSPLNADDGHHPVNAR